MNVKVVVIAGILIFLLIVIGPNPVEKYRRIRGSDPMAEGRLAEMIKKHNEKSQPGLFRGENQAPAAPARYLPNQPSQQAPKDPLPADGPVVNDVPPPVVTPKAESYYPPPPEN